MNSRSIKLKFLKTKRALNDTINRIMAINRERKYVHFLPDEEKRRAELAEELKVLNATAEFQSKVLKTYELKIEKQKAL